jgi:hypothetical protein
MARQTINNSMPKISERFIQTSGIAASLIHPLILVFFMGLSLPAFYFIYCTRLGVKKQITSFGCKFNRLTVSRNSGQIFCVPPKTTAVSPKTMDLSMKALSGYAFG